MMIWLALQGDSDTPFNDFEPKYLLRPSNFHALNTQPNLSLLIQLLELIFNSLGTCVNPVWKIFSTICVWSLDCECTPREYHYHRPRLCTYTYMFTAAGDLIQRWDQEAPPPTTNLTDRIHDDITDGLSNSYACIVTLTVQNNCCYGIVWVILLTQTAAVYDS